MIFTVVLAKIRSILLFFLSRFRRALCCFRRRRRPSCEVEPLTYVGVVSNQNTNDLDAWAEWAESNTFPGTSIQDHIESYRQQQAMLAAQKQEEENKDFFEDMTPKITKQTKVFINTNNSESSRNNSLSLVPESVNINGELGEWEENSGWEGQTLDWDVQEALRESKRLERERRMWEQQQRRMERSARPISLGAKINS